MKSKEPDYMGASERAELERLQNEQMRLVASLDRVGLSLAQEEQRVSVAVRSLDRLRLEQRSLESQMEVLSAEMQALKRQITTESADAAVSAELPMQPPELPIPPLLPEIEPAPAPAAVYPTQEQLQPATVTASATSRLPQPPPVPHEETVRAGVNPSRKNGSFEMRLGTYWLVRIGIVMLLSGMVFLGNYAYKNFVGKLGPVGKVTLLYLASGLLLGLGKWIGRQQENLKNYAQVLFAGGLAAVYFTTYAAHHVTPLRVISSPLLDGALLLGWAGFMVWLATRDKSETLALFAVGLGYYTSIITQVGLFTLYSNVILTAAAVFFLLRNRWATLTFGSLAATYAAYAFWRFNHHGVWRWASPEEGLWTGVYFLICYWVMFTAAVLLSRHDHFRGRNRALFLTLNNGAFFALFLLTMLQVQQGGFWKFALGYGSVLLGLAVVASRVLKPDRTSPNAYLAQGLLLVTLGFISYYTGLKLGLVLAVESVSLFVLSHLLRSRIMFAGSLLSGGLAGVLTLVSMDASDRSDLYLGLGVSALLFMNNLVKQNRQWPSTVTNQWSRRFFAVAGSLVLFKTTWIFCPEEFRAALLALEGLVLTLSCYVCSAKEFTLSGQAFLFAGQALCLIYLAGRLANPALGTPWPWWNPLTIIATALFSIHWWQRQKQSGLPLPVTQFLELVYSLTFAGLLYCGLKLLVSPSTSLVLTSLLAVGLTLYGTFTRTWFLAAVAQVFVFAASLQFVAELGTHSGTANGWGCLVPIASCVGLAWFGTKILVAQNRAPEAAQPGIGIMSRLYLWMAFGLSLGWIYQFVPSLNWFWILSLLGAFLFLCGGAIKNANLLLFGGCYTAVGLLVLWGRFWSDTIVFWPNFLGVLLLLAEQQVARRQPERFPVPAPVHGVTIALGGASLWLLLSKYVQQHAGGFYLTLAWGILALVLFVTGFLLRERNHRWAGLTILGLALGRVVFFDVWKLETIYRIFSFMGLGIVLLVLGFIYNKYQEKIREWL